MDGQMYPARLVIFLSSKNFAKMSTFSENAAKLRFLCHIGSVERRQLCIFAPPFLSNNKIKIIHDYSF